MIDLEDALAALVEHTPEPPGVDRVVRRAQQRRVRKRGVAFAALVAVIVAGTAGAVGIASSGNPSRVSTVVPVVDRVRLTMLDGSQIEVSGPPALGLTKLAPAFSASLSTGVPPAYGGGHTLSVERTPPDGLGAVVGRYPTHDGHELVVYATQDGVDAVVHYDSWVLVVTWNHDPTNWTAFASEVNAKETADGFLVVEPVDPGWKLGLGDGPDAQLGGTGYGGGATYSFFGPRLYPNGCPRAAETTLSTPQGWGVAVGTDPAKTQAREWCDADARVRIMVGDPQLGDAAVDGLRVAYTDADHAVADVTTLDGARFEITAPASVLDQLTLQKAVYVEGLDIPNLLNETPNLLPVSAERAGMPSAATEPSYPTADGHRLFSYTPPTDCGCQMLAGIYGPWLVEIEVQGMSDAQRTQIASLISVRETTDGFLVLDPVAPMHVGPGSGPDIVLGEVNVGTVTKCSAPVSVEAHTPEGFPVHFFGGEIWCDPNALVDVSVGYDPTHTLVDKIHVRRLP
jgi:hypothetical protein